MNPIEAREEQDAIDQNMERKKEQETKNVEKETEDKKNQANGEGGKQIRTAMKEKKQLEKYGEQ